MLESRKVYYEGLIAKEKWERTDSRIHVPTAAEVEKLRKLPRERVPVSVRPFISETSEQSGGT